MAGDEMTASEIDALVARYPLPEGVDDCVMNRQELADAFQTSLNTVTDWIGAGMPVEQVGGAGKAYELRLSACWAWRQARRAEEDLRSEQVKRAQAAMRLALVGGADGDSIEALDPKSRREILAVQIEHERFQAQRKQLMRRDDVRELTENLLMLMRDTLDAAPDRIERIEAIPPKVVDLFVGACDGLVEELHRRIAVFWELHREDRTPVKRDLFDA